MTQKAFPFVVHSRLSFIDEEEETKPNDKNVKRKTPKKSPSASRERVLNLKITKIGGSPKYKSLRKYSINRNVYDTTIGDFPPKSTKSDISSKTHKKTLSYQNSSKNVKSSKDDLIKRQNKSSKEEKVLKSKKNSKEVQYKEYNNKNRSINHAKDDSISPQRRNKNRNSSSIVCDSPMRLSELDTPSKPSPSRIPVRISKNKLNYERETPKKSLNKEKSQNDTETPLYVQYQQTPYKSKRLQTSKQRKNSVSSQQNQKSPNSLSLEVSPQIALFKAKFEDNKEYSEEEEAQTEIKLKISPSKSNEVPFEEEEEKYQKNSKSPILKEDFNKATRFGTGYLESIVENGDDYELEEEEEDYLKSDVLSEIKEDSDSVVEFLMTEERLRNSGDFIEPIIKKKDEEKEEETNSVSNYTKTLKIIRARIATGPLFREISQAMFKYKQEHFAILIRIPNYALEGVYIIKSDCKAMKRIWGKSPVSIEENEIERCFKWESSLKAFVDDSSNQISMETEAFCLPTQ